MNVTLVFLTLSTVIAALFNPLVSDHLFSPDPEVPPEDWWEQGWVDCKIWVVKGDRLYQICQER